MQQICLQRILNSVSRKSKGDGGKGLGQGEGKRKRYLLSAANTSLPNVEASSHTGQRQCRCGGPREKGLAGFLGQLEGQQVRARGGRSETWTN